MRMREILRPRGEVSDFAVIGEIDSAR
jgi:hypothetical protein